MYNELERFIEVLKEDPCDNIEHEGDGCTGCPYEHLWKKSYLDEHTVADGSCFEFRYAEHLIKNSAVLPPVDIGDKVWYIEGGYYNASYMRPKEIVVTEINKKKQVKLLSGVLSRDILTTSSLALVKQFFGLKKSVKQLLPRKRNLLKSLFKRSWSVWIIKVINF